MNYLYHNHPSLNRLFSGFIANGGGQSPGAFRVDVKEKDNGYQIYADLPGVSKDDVNIDVQQDTLTIGAKFPQPSGDNDNPVFTERFHGEYLRRFHLSQDIDAAGIDAKMKDGVLTLSLPKKKESEKRRITVK